MNYAESVEWLESLPFAMTGFGLEKITGLAELSGLRLEKLKAVHVAGSNGKGSTCAFIASALMENGYKTGLYTSPHLMEPTERIQVNGKKISRKKFAGLATHYRAIDEENGMDASYFEIATAMAFKHFIDEWVDFAVIEVGLGGRLDATNIINPLVSVITSISLEHTQYLGDTIEEIAEEKACIIKEKSVIVLSKNNAGMKTVEEKALAKNSKVICAEWKQISCTAKGNEFNLLSPEKISPVKTGVLGSFQCENAAVALAALLALNEKGYKLSVQKTLVGVRKARWPGRMQVLRKKPMVLIDGAHNPQGWETLAQELALFEYKKLFVVFGAMKDKEITKAGPLLEKAGWLAITKADNERAEVPGKIIEILGNGEIIVPVEKAVAAALEKAGKTDLVLVTGSLYVVGEALRRFGA